jgi:succinate dehydrogenase / fumarate reductase membrane anchor subunit
MDSKSFLEKAGVFFTPSCPVLYWRLQRLTAVALTPLTLWLLVFLNKAIHAPYAEMVNWLAHPFNSLCATLWTAGVFYHTALGVQVVIEDYVSNIPLRHKAILWTNLAFLLLSIIALLSIFRIFLLG